jgi:hypothetical protein
VSTDVSEEHIASIFRVEEVSQQEISLKAGGKESRWLATCLLAGFLLTYFFDPEDGGDMFLRNIG